jgi:hypothetical protein
LQLISNPRSGLVPGAFKQRKENARYMGSISLKRPVEAVSSLVAASSVVLLGLCATPANGQIQNALSAFPIEADGAYTTPDEWTDVTPAWFISGPTTGANPTFANDPNANSLLFAGLARDNPLADPELYLMYDYLPRTAPPTKPGEILGSVSFPLTLNTANGPVSRTITVEFVAPANLGTAGAPLFEIKVNTQDGQGFVDHPELGLEGGLGFGVTPASIVGAGSPFHNIPHELLELGVPLDIPAGFGTVGGPFPPGGQSGSNSNGYSPDPAFWQSEVHDNTNDPPASGGSFTINPDGSTSITPTPVAPIPSVVTNKISAFPIEADGAYTTPQEWTDVTPSWFNSDPVNGAIPTFPGDIAANSLLFASLGQDTPVSDPELYLMYDYLGRTTFPTQAGEFLGSVSFPLTLNTANGPVSKPITVEFVASASLGSNGTAFFEIKVDTHDGQGFVGHPELGLEGGAGFGVTPAAIVGANSPFHTTTHELLELGVPLVIPAGFGTSGGPFPPGGQSGSNSNGYSPDPAFWQSIVTDDTGDPPASGGLFTITPSGATTIVPQIVPPKPSQVNNAISASPIEADGAYTTPDEWVDITPAWFVSDEAGGATPTFPGDINANSLLFAGLGRDTPTSDPELYLMYEYLGRTLPPTQQGQVLGTISFPLTLNTTNGSVTRVISVEFLATANPVTLFQVLVDTQDGRGFVPHPELGLEAGLGFGVTPDTIVGATSPFHTTTHELIELGVPLNIPAGFGTTNGPFPPGGQSGSNSNGYSPDPAYWGSTVTDNSGDPPASGGLFTIHPDGSTGVVPNHVPAIPASPRLTMARGATNRVTLSWPEADMGFTLQASGDLATPNWHPVTPAPVISNLHNVVITSSTGTKLFYRLKH